MSLLGLLIFVLVCVAAFWLLSKAEIDGRARQIASIVLVVIFLLYLLDAFGILSGLGLNTRYGPR